MTSVNHELGTVYMVLCVSLDVAAAFNFRVIRKYYIDKLECNVDVALRIRRGVWKCIYSKWPTSIF